MYLDLYSYFPINSYANQLYVSSKTERDNMFDKFEHIEIKDLAYCNMSEQTIRVELSYYNGNKYNYGRIHNGDKIYYIFIRAVEWNTNNTIVTLHYEYDFFQTYLYNLSFKQCMVERHHVDDDTFGKWINDEGLDTGERIVQSFKQLNGGDADRVYCLSIRDTRDVISTGSNTKTALPQISNLTSYEKSATIVVFTDPAQLAYILNKCAVENRISAVSGLYTIPRSTLALYNQKTCYDWDTGDSIGTYLTTSSVSSFTTTVGRPPTVDGYTPKNNKCFMYPFCYVNLTNSNGGNMIARFEYSKLKSGININYRQFAIQGTPSYLWLSNYNGYDTNLNNTLTTNDHITIPWTADSYATYMSANQYSLTNTEKWRDNDLLYSTTKGGVNALISGVMGNPIGAMTSYANTVADSFYNYNKGSAEMQASLNDIKNTPPSMQGSFSANANNMIGDIGFKAETVTISYENIKTIDNYFTMYGYKTSHIINLKSVLANRKYWNYVKTVGANITGAVPVDGLNIIKSMFDSGCTLWHSLSDMYDYSKSNSIV